MYDVDGELIPHDVVEVSDAVRDLFSEIDADGSGEIDINEFALALKRLNMDPKDTTKLLAGREARR